MGVVLIIKKANSISLWSKVLYYSFTLNLALRDKIQW